MANQGHGEKATGGAEELAYRPPRDISETKRNPRERGSNCLRQTFFSTGKGQKNGPRGRGESCSRPAAHPKGAVGIRDQAAQIHRNSKSRDDTLRIRYNKGSWVGRRGSKPYDTAAGGGVRRQIRFSGATGSHQTQEFRE